jgi:hypothetical protein
MLAHASAYAFALLHNRLLLIHAPDVNLMEMFSSPWSGPLQISQEEFNRQFKKKHFNGTVLRIDASHDASPSDWKMLACKDKFEEDIIIIDGGQYFLPLLASRNTEWFLQVFGGFAFIYAQIAKYLFIPSPFVQQLVDENREYVRKSIGIQLRSFKLRYDRSQDVLVERCIGRLNLKNKNLFISSLYHEHARWFKDGYNTRMLSSFGKQDNSVLQYQYAFAEILLLAESDWLITSPYSTFGYTAAALQGEAGRACMLDIRLSCRKLTDVEPCFHRAPGASLHCPDGSLLLGNRSNIEACPDYHKRGIKLF